MRITGQLASGDEVAWIDVASPSSPHRVESVLAGAYHIGRSSSCHLRLGNDEIPDLLAVIIADHSAARISAQCETPVVLLNGEPVEDSPLADGDLLEAGPYTLVFHRVPNIAVSTGSDSEPRFDPRQASASQLVDALEEELHVVETQTHTREQGVRDLLSRLSGLSAEPRTAESDPDVIPMHDLHTLLRVLEQGQHGLRLQQEAILTQLDELRRRQDQILQALPPAEDSVVRLRTRRDVA